jgi:PAS domain S-box-containing protein
MINTSLKFVENKLQETTDFLEIAIETGKLAQWEYDIRSGQLNYSKQLTSIFGLDPGINYSPEDFKDKLYPEDRKKIEENIYGKTNQTGKFSFEARINKEDSNISWIKSKGKVYYDQQLSPLRIIGIIIDITDHKIVNEKLGILAAIVHSSHDAIISKTLEGIITSWNESAVRMFGYSPEEIIGKHISTLIPIERLDEEPKIISRLKRGERVDHFETQRITKTKRILDISLTISPVKDKAGNIIGASKIIRDITDQKLNEKLLRESEQKFRLLADSLPQLIWACDKNGNVNYVNHSFLDFTGLNYKENIDSGWLNLVHPDDKNATLKKWNLSLNNGDEFNTEHRLRKFNGEYLWHFSRIIPQKDTEGFAQMWVCTSTDVNERKLFTAKLENVVLERTKELERLNNDLKKSNNELAQFAYIASHDLQEPLRKIQTFANRIIQKEETHLSETGRDYFERMQKAAGRMQMLIDDLLTYSRTNVSEKVFEPTDLNILLQEIKIELEPDLIEKKAILQITPLPTLNIIKFQFRQLFTNLISNSLKFAKKNVPPKIIVSSDYINGNDIHEFNAKTDQLYYLFTVTDNGIGFSPEFKTRIFELFQRLHGKSEYQGTGIGLAICKKIVENHNGYIIADSLPEQGAKFSIYIPVQH